MLGSAVTVPVACSASGPVVGSIVIGLSGGPLTPLHGHQAVSSDTSSLAGSTVAPDLCSGRAMFAYSANYWAEVTSGDTTDPVKVEFDFSYERHGQLVALWGSSTKVVPVSPVAMGSTTALATSWAQSSWNPANWTGFTPPVGGVVSNPPEGLNWNSVAWNGTAWTSAAWNSVAWNSAAWNGEEWNSSAWNSAAWNSSAWNGATWSGLAWNGDQWD
jgi:hypothetical protein